MYMSKDEILNKIKELFKKCEEFRKPETKFPCEQSLQDISELIEQAYKEADTCKLKYLLSSMYFIGTHSESLKRYLQYEPITDATIYINETLLNVHRALLDDLSHIIREKCKCQLQELT
jgi:hypoxanthine-guanine phosphoribosyltransferase